MSRSTRWGFSKLGATRRDSPQGQRWDAFPKAGLDSAYFMHITILPKPAIKENQKIDLNREHQQDINVLQMPYLILCLYLFPN